MPQEDFSDSSSSHPNILVKQSDHSLTNTRICTYFKFAELDATCQMTHPLFCHIIGLV